uniref:DNA recombination and repair protein Rad51-like C-terminal domain-containing protein n=1 Tax=Dunaliella tertiolecta TaxID=3047 RepID=A0A7S3R583_DUNTE
MTALTLEQCLDFLAPDETLGQLYCRLSKEKLSTGIQAIDRHLALRPGIFLEACGGAGCGKSELLMQVAVHILMDGTMQQQQQQQQGPGLWTPDNDAVLKKSVVLIDMDGKLHGLRLIQVLDAHIRQRNPQLATLADDPQINPVLAEQASATINTLNEDCLARMHIIKPHSSMQLLAGLLSLPRLLAQCQERHAPCALLLVDNVGAFYQQDRACRPPPVADRDGSVGAKGGRGAAPPSLQPPLSLNRVHACMAATLQRLASEYRLCVVASKYAAVSEQTAPDGMPHLVQREYLPTSWHSLITHRLVMGPSCAYVRPADGSSVTEIVTQLWQV